MNLDEAILKRQSIRKFNDKTISKEDMKKIVDAGVLAPTGRNSQNLLIVGISNYAIVSEIMKHISGGKEFYDAKGLVLVFEKFSDNLSDLNAGACMENMLLEATSLGIASCWIHQARRVFDSETSREFLKTILNLDKPLKVLEGIALGYQEEATPRKEKDIKNGRVI